MTKTSALQRKVSEQDFHNDVEEHFTESIQTLIWERSEKLLEKFRATFAAEVAWN